MTQTTNIGLKKIDGSENWRQIFDYHNDSADKTDSAVSAVQDGIAIVANGDTHAAVEGGQFVYVRNHSTLAEGLYKAASAIGTNGELTTSNLTADSSGGLNDLQEQITALNSKIKKQTDSLTSNASGYAKIPNITTANHTVFACYGSGFLAPAFNGGDGYWYARYTNPSDMSAISNTTKAITTIYMAK